MDKNRLTLLPITAIIATYDRPEVLKKTLESLSEQSHQPSEIIIVDSSDNEFTKKMLSYFSYKLSPKVVYQNTIKKGAAVQRAQGLGIAKHPLIFFFDDDIIFNDACIEKLWSSIVSSEKIGGVNAMITNQKYSTPGRITRYMYRLLSERNLTTYAGMCIGPAWNILPEDDDKLPELVKVDWLNSTCTLYRKVALPDPLFDSHFSGYSLMEDLALSLKVSENWELYNVRKAQIFHDSQPGAHKNRVSELSRMEMVNRYFIMVNILKSNSIVDHFKFFFHQSFQVLSILNMKNGWRRLPLILIGKFVGLWQIMTKKF